MAKAKKESVMTSKLRIETCEKCSGKPKEEDFIAKPFKGKRCSECWEVISFDKITITQEK